jgi:hypothetical protein
MTIVRMIYTSMISTLISGVSSLIKERSLFPDLGPKESVMIINYTFLEATRRNQAIFTRTCSTMIFLSRSGLM